MSADAQPQPDNDGLLPGFADPVHGAQQAFRAILNAMARPGRIYRCGSELATPAPLGPAMAAVCLTLADADTPLWLSDHLSAPAVSGYLRFHCNPPMVAEPDRASFALAALGELPDLGGLGIGDDLYPDRSATVVAEVRQFARGGEGDWRLSGPGIADSSRLRVTGLPEDFPRAWRRNAALFPQGVDLILTCGDRLAALPRTTHVEG
jgi:alpha-D-ribose 1-methylphosphonate 5-triphosphate synthase subunit PhnH